MSDTKSTHLETIRLLVFVEQRFWQHNRTFSTDEPFVRFLDGLLPYVHRLIYLARLETESRIERYELVDGCTVWSVPYYANLIVLAFTWPFILPRIAWMLIQRRREWDMACIGGPHPIGLTVALVCRMLRRPFFFVIRENLPTMVHLRYPLLLRPPGVAMAKLLECAYIWLSRCYPALIVGKEVQQKYKRSGALVHPLVVSLVTKHQIWIPPSSKTTDTHYPFRLLTVGRLAPEKGVSYLLEALASLHRSGIQMHLNIVGDGPERTALESMVHNLKLESLVCFQGYVPYGAQLLHFYRGADVFVLPSLTEGFPQALVEAMANSLPIVATSVGGVPHFIQHEYNGLLVSAESPRELAAALSRLAVDGTLRAKLSAAAQQTAMLYSREAQVNVIADVMMQLQGQR